MSRPSTGHASDEPPTRGEGAPTSTSASPSPSSGAGDSDLSTSLGSLVRAIARAPGAAPRDVPERVAGFRIVERLGSGGMGSVYRAEDEQLRRPVALKLPHGSAVDGDERRQRFLREARAAAAIVHPNVAVVYQVGEADGRAYIAMELVEGATLRRLLRQGALTSAQLRDVALQIARGLAAAHEKGIVHRDLKPENVMITVGSAVKLLDFGLAKSGAHPADPEHLGTADTEELLTREGEILGTSAYMSPEQALGLPVDARSDVFSYGIVLYEMVAGRRPFSGATSAELRAAITTAAPAALPAGGDALLARVAMRALAKPVEARFADARAIVVALEERDEKQKGVAGDTERSAPPAMNLDAEAGAYGRSQSGAPRGETKRRRWLAWTGAAAVVAVAVAAALTVRGALRRSTPAPLPGMIYFAGGQLTVGRTHAEIDEECRRLGQDCRKDAIERETPQHLARLSPFYLDVNETTNAQFARWIAGRALDLERDPASNEPRFVRDNATKVLLADIDPEFSGLVPHANETLVPRPGYEGVPVVQITWDAARLYCAGAGKRLPTETEWELAARGNTTRRFPWGDDDLPCSDVVVARFEGLRCAGESARPQPIDAPSRDWSPEGIHDLAGNVSEWMEDAFVAPTYVDCGDCVDPVVEPDHPDPASEYRVFRGGAWANSIFSHASARGRWSRTAVSRSLGVRCAVSAKR